jgi:hypothetical protein
VSVRTAATAGAWGRDGRSRLIQALERERLLAEIEVAECRRLFD